MASVAESPGAVPHRSTVARGLRLVESALETANALDRAADRIRNPRVAAVLHERAEARREAARSVRARVRSTGAL